MDVPVHLNNHLRGKFEGGDVNIVLRMQGRTLYYFARWLPLSGRHRIQCVDAVVPDKPMLWLEPLRLTQSSVYRLSNANT